MKVVQFIWDNAKGEDHNGKHIMIGQHLPKTENDELTHVNIYGLSVDIIDPSKDWQLKRLTCSQVNVDSEVKVITKEEARELIMTEIDKALEVLFNPTEIQAVDRDLNVEEFDEDSQCEYCNRFNCDC